MSSAPISLACLDMAGTTVADDGSVMAAFTAALVEAGLGEGSPEFNQAHDYAVATMGQSKITVFRSIFPSDENLAVRANKAFEGAYAATLATGGAVPIPGATEAIAQLRSSGVRVALTTGFSADTRDALIDALGWSDLCDLVLSPSDAGRGRPYPDLLLTALIRLGVDDVAELAAVGDTASDLLAGSRSGAGIVAGVRTGAHTDQNFASVPHTHVINSVADLPALIADHNAQILSHQGASA